MKTKLSIQYKEEELENMTKHIVTDQENLMDA
jgi:hypothetical protein